ncbi:MAG: hypothetical protein Ct9H90mP16_05010 [Candidatus Poseidoniales archaeon]|nr:MAG: hypothetical protein Ct9H90mP16_05010 [Candidatus Poseidoniales archaeon]
MPTGDVELYLSTVFESEDCARMFVPIHDNFNPEEADFQAVADLGDLTSSSCVPMAVLRLSTWRTSPMINCASPLTITAYGQLKSFLMMLMGPSSILISHLMAMISHNVHIDDDNTLYYSPKSNGRWTTSTSPPSLTQVSGPCRESRDCV